MFKAKTMNEVDSGRDRGEGKRRRGCGDGKEGRQEDLFKGSKEGYARIYSFSDKARPNFDPLT